ncbi:hypothetical protein MHYP_G00222350 [Metynnis hypsauchen]
MGDGRTENVEHWGERIRAVNCHYESDKKSPPKFCVQAPGRICEHRIDPSCGLLETCGGAVVLFHKYRAIFF